MLVAHARVHALATAREPVARAIGELSAEASREQGCVEYRAGEMLDEPGEFLVVAVWMQESSMRAHYASAAYGRFAVAVTPLLARPSDTAVYTASQAPRPVVDLSSEPLRAD